jgi:hypothetical protein
LLSSSSSSFFSFPPFLLLFLNRQSFPFRYPLGGGKAAPKRQEIVTDQKEKKKLDKKSDKSMKYTGDLCLKLGLEVEEEKARKQVFAVTASKAIQIEDYNGVCSAHPFFDPL